MKPIISVEGLGKKYLIKHKDGHGGYRSLREELFQLPKKFFSKKERIEDFWALEDVSFDVMPGDRIGIIGRNGAGKSTLLKLLSRITEPSTGKITMRGRVASLLEVGTGFHPELTGRENIFLNGAVLGMPRTEVRRKFDEIVAFAGVEKFLDTPVKRYSSGMYVRLAFSVAAHLEPEILVVDEVLAVGDAEFQKKCLGKMEEVSKELGRTVLFVSHNMGAVQRLCDRGILLVDGKLQVADSISKSVIAYNACSNIAIEEGGGDLFTSNSISFHNVIAKTKMGNVTKSPISGQPVLFELNFLAFERISNARAVLHIVSSLGNNIVSLSNYWFNKPFTLTAGQGKISFEVEKLPLPRGTYQLFVELKSDVVNISRFFAGEIQIELSDFFESHVAGNQEHGVMVEHSVSVQYNEEGPSDV